MWSNQELIPNSRFVTSLQFFLPSSEPTQIKAYFLTVTPCAADSLFHTASLLLNRHFLHIENGTVNWKFARLVNKIEQLRIKLNS